MMRIPFLSGTAAGLLVLLLFCAACTSGQSNQTPATENATVATGGFSAVAIANGSQVERFTLEEAESAALQANQSFFYLRGEHVDSSGKAERWIFGVHEGNTSSMQVYDKNGVSTVAMPPGLPIQGDVPVGGLSLIDALKIADSSSGAGAVDLTDGMATLQLMNGEYTITGPSSSSQGITINATTGELSSTHG
jgi:hypothetical protein